MKNIASSRRNQYLTRVSIFLITAALIAGMAGCTGDGYTPSQNLEIRTWYDLDAVRNNLAGHHTLMNDLNSTTAGYEQLAGPTADGGKGWQPIGTQDSPFTGSFDGQGHEICGLFSNRTDEDGVGFFGTVWEDGVIKDIGVTNVTVTGRGGVGGLVGGIYAGTVSNSYSSGNVTGDGNVGGLVGGNIGTVSNSYSSGSVSGDRNVGGLVGINPGGIVNNSYATGSVNGTAGVGGLVGENWSPVSNSSATGNVTGNDRVGGLVGINTGTVSNSCATGNITGNEYVGGLVGAIGWGNVSNSYYNCDEVLINGENIITIGALFDEDLKEWLANNKSLDVNERFSQEDGYYLLNNVSDFKQLLAFGQSATLKFRLKSDMDLSGDPNFYIPYLAGEFDGNGHKISNLSFNFGFVSDVGLFGYLAPGGKVTQIGVENVNITGGNNVGGLVGQSWGTVSNSYVTGRVDGGNHVGGLVGANSNAVSNSYSTASVTSDNIVGGLVGFNFEEATVSSSFWDLETSGQNISAGGTGKNTTEMHDIVTFSGADWNITTVANSSTRDPTYIWNIVSNLTYPFLSWQPI